MKTPEEYLKDKGITINSNDHHYEWLYNTMTNIIKEVRNKTLDEVYEEALLQQARIDLDHLKI